MARCEADDLNFARNAYTEARTVMTVSTKALLKPNIHNMLFSDVPIAKALVNRGPGGHSRHLHSRPKPHTKV